MRFNKILKTEHELPDIYEGIITKDEYNDILKICIEFHNEKGIDVLKIENGGLHIKNGDQEQYRYLDNLVRSLANNPLEEWKDRIYNHFSALKKSPEDLKKIYENFDDSKQFLRVVIKNESFIPGDLLDDFIYRTDFPNTRTFLVSEIDGLFHYMKKDFIDTWTISEKEIFKIAINNIPNEEIELQKHDIDDKFTFFGFYSGDFSASIILDLKNRADFLIGTYGSIIAIPSKATSIVYPIEKNDVLEFIKRLYPDILTINREDQGAITSNFYWLYNDVCHLIALVEEEDGNCLLVPDELQSLFIKYNN